VTRVLLALVLVALAPRMLIAQADPPRLTGAVNDFANVLDPASREAIADLSARLGQATGDVLVVAAVDTVQPWDIQGYAVKMFENGGRGIGARGKENGILILLAVKDRKVRIEVGYGLEEFIPDGFAGEVSRETMTPYFRQGEYGAGLRAGAERVAGRLAEARETSIPGLAVREAPRARSRPSARFPIGLIVFLVLWILFSRPWRRGRRRAWGGGPWSGWSSGVGPFGGGFGGGFGVGGGSSGGFGGGFGGFGGGRSGGGGGGGSW
jgi:uncharacterized protein